MRLILPGLLGLLAACDPTTTVPDDTAGDTGSGNDSGDTVDTADTADTADSGDTGDTATVDPNLAFDVDGDTTGLAFSLVTLELGTDGSGNGTVAMADILAEEPASSRIELFAEPASDSLVEVPDVPGVYYAYAVGGLHEDDGDGRWDPDEDWVGAPAYLAMYLDGVLPTELIDAGYTVGWNAVSISDGSMTDPLAIPLPVLQRRTLTVGGGNDGTIGAADAVTTVAASLFAGADAPALDDEDLAGNTWSLTLDGEPPPSHFEDIDSDGTVEAVEAFAAYTDTAGGPGFDVGSDTLVGFACRDGAVVVGWWVSSSPDLTRLFFLPNNGVALGWNALEINSSGGDPTILTESEAQDLTLSANCSP